MANLLDRFNAYNGTAGANPNALNYAQFGIKYITRNYNTYFGFLDEESGLINTDTTYLLDGPERGDPASGAYVKQSKDIEEFWTEVLQLGAVGDPAFFALIEDEEFNRISADNGLQNQIYSEESARISADNLLSSGISDVRGSLANGRVWGTASANISSLTLPGEAVTDVDFIVSSGGHGAQLWYRIGGAPSDINDPEFALVNYSSGVQSWYKLAWGDNNSPISQIVGGDDPSGLDVPVGAKNILQFNNAAGTFTIWREIGAPTDLLETDTVKKSADNRWWSKMTSNDAVDLVAAEESARISADNGLQGQIAGVGECEAGLINGQPGHAIVFDNTEAKNVLLSFYTSPENFGLDGIFAPSFYAKLGGGGGGGVTPSTGLITDTTELQIISGMGQSLLQGFPFDVSAGAPTWGLGDGAFIIEGLKRSDSDIVVIGPRGALSKAFDYTVTGTGLIPIEPDGLIPTFMGPATASLNYARRAANVNKRTNIVSINGGYSGVSWELIDDEPLTGSTEDTIVWDNQEYWYEQAKIVGLNAGYSKVVCPWHVFVHGTSAKADPQGEYYAFLDDYQTKFRALLASKEIGGAARFVMSQSGGDSRTNQSGENWYVKEEQLRFCQEGRGVLSHPFYAIPIADNNVHPSGEWTTVAGQMAAWAIAEEDANRAWTTLGPKDWSVNGNTVKIHLDARPDDILVVNDAAKYAGDGIDQWLGFEAIGATITGLHIGKDFVEITCSAVPTAIHYAFQVQNTQGFTGNMYNAHRGLLRTTKEWPLQFPVNAVVNTGGAIEVIDKWHRWVPSFKISL